MRLIVSILIIWALILGFFVTGVKVVATPPLAMPVQVAQPSDNDLQRVDLDRARPSGEVVRPAR
jgi:hypothetical protein